MAPSCLSSWRTVCVIGLRDGRWRLKPGNEIGQNLTPAGNAPLVSVLVTTYNHARYVEEALESLRRQTSKEFEVIITDDASTD
ncbi:glycosyltransferase family 2 protein, partial [Bradyrhizobium sp.]|uniref:glycosyltransferase family 2 protein n=1 Tax=Bradyrhizobium sp. TaxID=376 RepID=UPI0035227CBD